MNKKAQFILFKYMIVIFLAVILFASLVWVMGKINTVMHNVGVYNDQVNSGSELYVNMTEASDITFGSVNQSIQALRMVSLIYILGLGVAIVITSALQQKYPWMFFVYLMIWLLAIVTSPLISNAYETLLNSNIMEGTLNTFSASNFLILNLPMVILIIGALSTIFLLINSIRLQGEAQID